MSRYAKPLVAADFDVPMNLVTPHFTLRILSPGYNDRDYEAVMASASRLRALFGRGWPREGFTLAENMADLEMHEGEFHRREAFAYTVVTPDEQRVLGSVYIKPSPTHDAEVTLWIRTEDQAALEPLLFSTTREWISSAWPFQMVLYPGRE